MATSARERLIDAAFELFDEQGYDQTTVDEIAARAGVGRTTFFRLFRGKDDVIFPAHDAILEDVAARLDTATAETMGVALTEATGLVLAHYLAQERRARRRYELTRSVPALRDREYALMRRYQQLFREFAAGYLPDTAEARLRAELLANAVVTAHNHVLRRWLRGETQEARAEFAAAMGQVLRMHALADCAAPAGAGPQAAAAGEPGPAVLVVRTRKDLARLLPELERLLS